MSFESRNFLGDVLRHSNFQLFRQPMDGTALFRADATSAIPTTIPDPGAAENFSRTGSSRPPMDSGWLSSHGRSAAIEGQTSSMCAPRIRCGPGPRW